MMFKDIPKPHIFTDMLLDQSELFYENNFENLDLHVQETMKKCSDEGKLTSMIKLELKTKIQLQKLTKGENFDVEWRKESNHQLTPEDLERRKNLRERNKLSARKHRNKKKQENFQQQKEMEELLKNNELLKQKIEKLESVRNKMYLSLGLQVEEKVA